VFAAVASDGIANAIGGLVGSNYGTITKSYSAGSVSAAGEGRVYMLGGLVGQNMISGPIADCYSTSSVSSIGWSQLLGGLVGENSDEGTITDCYSTGPVSAIGTTHDIGGLVGGGYAMTMTSFWNTETSGQATSGGGTGITTAQMKTLSTFADPPASWDFADTWHMQDGVTFPYLDAGVGANLPIKGDLDGDGDVDFSDLALMAANWLESN
jgi:hypothetical protein